METTNIIMVLNENEQKTKLSYCVVKQQFHITNCISVTCPPPPPTVASAILKYRPILHSGSDAIFLLISRREGGKFRGAASSSDPNFPPFVIDIPAPYNSIRETLLAAEPVRNSPSVQLQQIIIPSRVEPVLTAFMSPDSFKAVAFTRNINLKLPGLGNTL
jgi:hypothetical protein